MPGAGTPVTAPSLRDVHTCVIGRSRRPEVNLVHLTANGSAHNARQEPEGKFGKGLEKFAALQNVLSASYTLCTALISTSSKLLNIVNCSKQS